MRIVDSVAASGERFDDWSFGGGTVLMRRFRHRLSKDVDIFVPDPQYLGYVSPRLNDTAADLTPSYLETATSVKLYFPEGGSISSFRRRSRKTPLRSKPSSGGACA
jgi:hypothetical protein